MEDILKIKINNELNNNKNNSQKDDEILESSFNDVYYESTNILPLDEYEDI